MHQSVRTAVLIVFWLENRVLLRQFGYVSLEVPVAHILASITVSLIRVEVLQRTL
jgi:hypothetical protein